MTTFQDPPLQSRRSVRQDERDESQPAAVASAAPAAAPAPAAEPLTYATQGDARLFPTTTARASASAVRRRP